jgi:hypothetical protein
MENPARDTALRRSRQDPGARATIVKLAGVLASQSAVESVHVVR